MSTIPSELVLELALEAGFDLAGLAPLAPPAAGPRFAGWLAAGRHADMEWLERQRERILDPRGLVDGPGTLLVVGLAHSRRAVELPGGGRIARYAAGRDYHNLMGKRLRKLARRLAREGLTGRSRTIVDAGPLLERAHAEEAGLGFASKAANLLHPRFGPWFFLGELVLPVELDPTPAPPAGSCGTCTACLDACPTRAIPEPGVIDANLCLSYHTIENRGAVPEALEPLHGDWAFGCDICSEVCPWGHRAPDRGDAWGTHPAAETRLVDWLRVPESEFAARFEGSPLRRARRSGLARNAAQVLGNRPSDPGRRALSHALAEDPSPLVRAAAGSALARGHGRDDGTADELERAREREPDEDAAAALERARARCRDS